MATWPLRQQTQHPKNRQSSGSVSQQESNKLYPVGRVPIVPSTISFFADHYLPGWIAPLVLGAQPSAREQTIRDILDPLSSAECNSHLIMFVLDSVLMTLIPEMGNTTDASMMDGPPLMVRTQSRLARPGLDQGVPSGGSLNCGENEDSVSEKGRNPSPSQSSAITGMYVHV